MGINLFGGKIRTVKENGSSDCGSKKVGLRSKQKNPSVHMSHH
jgi:hypothetical protein